MPTGAANLLSQGATSPAVSSHTVETNPLSTSSATTREASGDSFESTPKTSGYKFDFSSTRLVKRIQDFIDTPFDFNNLQESSIHLELPFSGGKFAFQTHTHVPAQVKVKPGTKIILDIETCVKDGLACIKTCHVKFTKPVTLYNPASALSPATGQLSRMFNWAKDKLCKFKINGLSLDPLNGHIKPDGIAKCVWPLKDKPFSKIIDSNRLPKAILSLNEIKEKRNLFQLKSSSRDESTTITDSPSKEKAATFLTFFTQGIQPGSLALKGKISPEHIEGFTENVFFDIDDAEVNLLENGVSLIVSKNPEHHSIWTSSSTADLKGGIKVQANAEGKYIPKGDVTLHAENSHGKFDFHTDISRNESGLLLTHGSTKVQVFFPKETNYSLSQVRELLPMIHGILPAIFSKKSGTLNGAKLELAMAQISFDYVNGQLIGRNGLGTFEAKQKGFSVECEGADIDVDFEKSLKFNGCAANVDVEIDEKVVHIHSPEKVKVKGRLVT